MKRWSFGAMTALVSAANGTIFFGLSYRSMERGIPGVDNQAALLFIPLLWFIALGVLVVLNVGTLLYGCLRVERGAVLHPVACFCAPAHSPKERACRIAFEIFACCMMTFAYLLWRGEGTRLWAAAYALSGGLLLALLDVWHRAGQTPSK